MTLEQQQSLERELKGAMEEWRPVVGYEGLYVVSSFGRVVGLPNNRHDHPFELALKNEKSGYVRVTLIRNGKTKLFPVHRLVANAFISNPFGKPQVNHIDENKRNNCVENLEWVTAKENCNHGTRKARIFEKQLNKNHARPILQKTKDGVVVCRYPSTAEIPRASRGVYKRANVCHCLKGEMPYAYGFIWEYEKEKTK